VFLVLRISDRAATGSRGVRLEHMV
jgi:hypothetical protein